MAYRCPRHDRTAMCPYGGRRVSGSGTRSTVPACRAASISQSFPVTASAPRSCRRA
ncbi:hypothetical protein GTY68_06805 [Streptomyces sp. SID4926]|nr:hypothetical protein [Streptomyces sp. SID4926]